MKETNKMKKIALVNHGCAKNLVDSELMLGILAKNGYKITLDERESDIVIVNTCSFIHDAEKESVASILNLINEGKKVIIAGCLIQKYRDEMKKLFPEAAGFVGTSDFNKIAEIIKQIDKTPYEVSSTPLYCYPEDVERQQITIGASSYLKIAEGCNYSCGYCVIPKLRGKYTSRPIEKIVEEAKHLVKKGVSEIVLIAQDTTMYGVDIYGEPKLPELIEELNKIEDLTWLRIMYTYPTGLTDKLLKTMAKCEKVVKYIDIPLQHKSKNVLKLMNRPISDYTKLIGKIRKIMPSAAIRTTFIVGYPGETEEDFKELYDFIEKSRFDRLGVFEYSREKGTISYSLPNQIRAKIKKQRRNTLMKLQQKISLEINSSLIGKEIECIVENISDDGIITGRTYKDAPEVDGVIFIKNDDTAMPGDVIKVKVTGCSAYDLYSGC
ncbi:30S ribosomal protein S12 methylthiotransferase RimO [bacterium]|nr:30S ribosomal protein S12 methylthiotransferase RimO [bacterium]